MAPLTAAGPDGITSDLVKQLADGPMPPEGQRPDPTDTTFLLRVAMVKVFNLILRGQGGIDPSDWCRSRLVPIEKKDGGIRPIVISDVWLRLLDRTVARKVCHKARTLLAPFQFGVGIKGGCEVVVHALQMLSAVSLSEEDVLRDPNAIPTLSLTRLRIAVLCKRWTSPMPSTRSHGLPFAASWGNTFPSSCPTSCSDTAARPPFTLRTVRLPFAAPRA